QALREWEEQKTRSDCLNGQSGESQKRKQCGEVSEPNPELGRKAIEIQCVVQGRPFGAPDWVTLEDGGEPIHETELENQRGTGHGNNAFGDAPRRRGRRGEDA